jgi:hypothetical protein
LVNIFPLSKDGEKCGKKMEKVEKKFHSTNFSKGVEI